MSPSREAYFSNFFKISISFCISMFFHWNGWKIFFIDLLRYCKVLHQELAKKRPISEVEEFSPPLPIQKINISWNYCRFPIPGLRLEVKGNVFTHFEISILFPRKFLALDIFNLQKQFSRLTFPSSSNISASSANCSVLDFQSGEMILRQLLLVNPQIETSDILFPCPSGSGDTEMDRN